MIFYHGTSEETWKEIQEEGILFGKQEYRGSVRRFTYLATDKEEAMCYGNVLLEVEFDPFENKNNNNYCDGCWQIRVYDPIPLKKIKRIDNEKD